MKHPSNSKVFLFLQGPHGPFFYELSKALIAAGIKVKKIGFNEGDHFFWKDSQSYYGFVGEEKEWKSYFKKSIKNGVTDLVLYGDVRVHHKQAIKIAKEMGITVHCFEEGYLRPYWVTYERGGVNGNSRLMSMSVSDMQKRLTKIDEAQVESPANWGDLRKHILYGAVYHWHILFRNGHYPHYLSHRGVPVSKEFYGYSKKLLSMPLHFMRRFIATRKLKRSADVYHLVLLQLAHDASIQDHSDFKNMVDFISLSIRNFSKYAPRHHHLVIKGHPLEDYRVPLEGLSLKFACKYNVMGRVHFIRGGKLAELLDHAKTVLTINSTAAQQALWRGLPLKVLGESVYSKPEFISNQTLSDFYTNPMKPNLNAYRDYRRYLLATSQISGGFYSSKSRARLIRRVIDMVLSNKDPYELLSELDAAPVQQLKLVL